MLKQLYGHSLSLLTDLYQLTMAYGYWKLGTHEREAVFHLNFRKPPFNSGYTVAAGLAYACELMEVFKFDESDLTYIASLTGNDDKPLFEKGFIGYLRDMMFSCEIDAVPEGTLVFPHQPLVRVKGPILQCQILETPLLNIINFQTLIATKAARVVWAAQGDPVLEFGLRRAQGIDGALASCRASYIGGVSATSNVLAGKLFGIPVKGTHAHSWVMSFDDELEAFEGYAEAMPNNCVFLVDTYDTLEGVRKAVKVGLKLKAKGYKMVGVRLDSGDLAYLSIEARKILDEAGFEDAAIVASNDLDENLIESLKSQGAQIRVWGVGTKMATAYDQPALGGVYKLGAIKDANGNWVYKVKASEQSIKQSIPGILQVRRYEQNGEFVADVIYDEIAGAVIDTIIDPADGLRRKAVPEGAIGTDLLVPIFRNGKCVYGEPLSQTRARTQEQLSKFHAGVKRLVNPHQYTAGIERTLFERRQNLVLKAKGFAK